MRDKLCCVYKKDSCIGLYTVCLINCAVSTRKTNASVCNICFLLAVQWITQTLYVFIHKLIWLCVDYLNSWFKRQKLVWTQYQVICVHACMHSSCDIRGRMHYFLYQLYLYICMLPCGFNFSNLYWSLCCDGRCFCLQDRGILACKM